MVHKKIGVYLLPHALTTVALSCGFYALTVGHDLQSAAAVIFAAMIFDVLDGKVARAMGVASEFGKAYDSLSDLVTFGVAPAFLMYQSHLYLLGRMGWVLALVYVVAGALRLARYNSQEASIDFCGLPIPAAAALIVGSLWWLAHTPLHIPVWIFAAWTLLAAFLMVSTFPYQSLKSGSFARPFSLLVGLMVVLVLGLVWLEPATSLLTIFVGYALTGPMRSLYQKLK